MIKSILLFLLAALLFSSGDFLAFAYMFTKGTY